MTTIAATSSAAAYSPVAAPGPSDEGQPPARSTSGSGDPFGPAVIVELSPAAREIMKRPMTVDERVEDMQSQFRDWAKKQGKSDQEIQATLAIIDKGVREGLAKLEESRKYESQARVFQPNLEQTLSDTGGPQSLINAVRDVTSLRYDVGAASISAASYGTEENRARVRLTHGEDYLQRAITRGKLSDAQARGSAFGSAARLSRYGIDGPAFTVADGGVLKLNSFTLQNVGGGYALSFDAETSEFKVSKQGNDITALIFAGEAFG